MGLHQAGPHYNSSNFSLYWVPRQIVPGNLLPRTALLKRKGGFRGREGGRELGSWGREGGLEGEIVPQLWDTCTLYGEVTETKLRIIITEKR